MGKLENLKKEISVLNEDELFDIYEFIDDLILIRILGVIKQKGPRDESLFEKEQYI